MLRFGQSAESPSSGPGIFRYLLVLVILAGAVAGLVGSRFRVNQGREGAWNVPDIAPLREEGGDFPGLDRDQLQEVLDDSLMNRPDEQDAWFHLWTLLKDAEEEEVEEFSLGRVSYTQLDQQPQVYRGDIVTIYGKVRRAHRLTAPANNAGIESYYQLYVFPVDHLNTPLLVYCLDLPPDFPTGMEIDEKVKIAGFSYKRVVYLGRDEEIYLTPSILAKSLTWHDATMNTEEAGANDSSSRSLGGMELCGLLLASALVAAAAVAFLWRRNQGQSPQFPEQLPDPDALTALAKAHEDALSQENEEPEDREGETAE
jgi:hypothetical protein